VIFRELWFLGRTSFTLICLLLLISYSWKPGAIAAIVFFGVAGIEMLLKSIFSRPRPFQINSNISMLQPQQPVDPSFPSGDTLRVWYLALILAAVIGGNPLLFGAVTGLALLVSLGRLVMGVHYLTDILSGAGLGVIGGGATLLLWDVFQLI
jgi:undecaprenyl-diphosphatase